MALAISIFTEYQLFAPFWLLPGCPWSAGYWQAVLGCQNSSYVCLGSAHADIWVTIDSSKSQRPVLTKTSWPSVMVSRDKWIQLRWLSWESVHWSKLKDTWGAYHLSEETGWNERSIIVRVFPKSANEPNEMALTICNLISRNCFWLMRDWKLESWGNGEEISAVLFRMEKEECLWRYSTISEKFPENELTIWL